MRRLVLALALLGVLCAPCNAQEPTQTPSQRIWRPLVFTPPVAYGMIWRLSEECAGVERDMAGVTWIVADFILSGRDRLAGRYIYPQRVITLDWTKWDDAQIVAHEILHDLWREDVTESSPRFQGCIAEVVQRFSEANR